MAEPSDRIEALREEQLGRLFISFESKSKNLRTLFFAVSGFAFVFFLFVLFPYAATEMQARHLDRDLKALSADIKASNEEIASIDQSKAGLERLYQEMGKSRDELREFVINMVQEEDEPQNQLPKNRLTPNGRVRAKVLQQIDTYQGIVLNEIVAPLAARQDDGRGVDLAQLENEVSALRDKAEQMLDQKPDFWRSYAEKGEFYNDLSEDVRGEFNQVQKLASQKLDALKASVTKKRETSQASLADQKLLNLQMDGLAEKLKNIQSPVGNFPVGLSESILAYPVLLAIGCVMLSLYYRDTLRLRGELHRLYREKDPQQLMLTDQQFCLIAPLWIDPLPEARNRFIYFFVAAALPVIFFISILLIAQIWSLSGELTAVPGSQVVYFCFYLASCAAVVVMSWQAIGDFRIASQGTPVASTVGSETAR